MASKSPFTEEIYKEWDRLVFEIGYGSGSSAREPDAEQVEGWKKLYERTFADGKWLVPFDDAGLVATLGWTIAMRQFRYGDAVVLANQLLNHPDSTESKPESIDFKVNLGASLIMSGDVDGGTAVLKETIVNPGRWALQTTLHVVRNELRSVLSDLGLSNSPDPRLIALVKLMMSFWKGHKRKASLVGKASTNQELLEILDSTYPHRKVTPSDSE